ncbi:hypothetical protein [Kribbella sp. DT2]|uniref:hypothetical protein n=1 Tax=Kribbella sp. DT2 TaxID=3393427 RepID=UPI003CFAA01B
MVEFFIPVIVVIVIMVVSRRLKAQGNESARAGTLTPRMQRMIEKMQAQQGFQQPPPQGQFTQPADGHGSPGYAGSTVQSSAQMAGLHNSQYHGPTPYAGAPTQAQPFSQPLALPGQFQPPAPWYPPQGQAQRAVHAKPSQRDLDHRVREMMQAGNEVGAVRLLCDEQDLGIIDAQKRARALVAPAGGNGGGNGGDGRDREAAGSSTSDGAPDQETRYVGSAAFADSLFDANHDDAERWASGWVDKPEADDRSDIDELWKTVRERGLSGPEQGRDRS